MKSTLLLLFTLSLGTSVFAQGMSAFPIRTSAEIENSCRTKAKEIAAETYRGCVADTKNIQIEQIKREYQVKLMALRAYYEAELQKLSASKVKLPSENPSEKISEKLGEKLEAEEASGVSQDPVALGVKEAVAGSKDVTTESSKVTEVVVDTQSGNVSEDQAGSSKVDANKELDAEAKAIAKPEVAPTVKAPKKVVKKKSSAASIPSALAKSPSKKSIAKQKIASKKVPGKKAASFMPTEMTVRLKPAPVAPMRDDSTMDLPEPIPVENLSGGSSI